MKITVDFDLCQSHAVCCEEAPTVFQLDKDDYLALLQESPDAALREAVEAAVKYCPTQALSLATNDDAPA